MKTRKRKVSKASRESMKKFFCDCDRKRQLGYFRSARYAVILVCLSFIGCNAGIYPGMPFDCVTIVRNEIKPGCYRNPGNWVKTNYPDDWQIDYDWQPVNADIEPKCQR